MSFVWGWRKADGPAWESRAGMVKQLRSPDNKVSFMQQTIQRDTERMNIN